MVVWLLCACGVCIPRIKLCMAVLCMAVQQYSTIQATYQPGCNSICRRVSLYEGNACLISINNLICCIYIEQR